MKLGLNAWETRTDVKMQLVEGLQVRTCVCMCTCTCAVHRQEKKGGLRTDP